MKFSSNLATYGIILVGGVGSRGGSGSPARGGGMFVLPGVMAISSLYRSPSSSSLWIKQKQQQLNDYHRTSGNFDEEPNKEVCLSYYFVYYTVLNMILLSSL
jgi:hypothetical protein